MEDIECTFTSNTSKKSSQQKPLGQPKNSKTSPLIDDYSSLPGKSLLKRTLSLQHPRSSFIVGDTNLFDQTVLSTVPLDKNNQATLSTNLTLRRISNDSLFIVRTDQGVSQWIRESDEIERAVSPYGWALINCYFQYCQPCYPILHEKVFLEKYQRTYRELTPALLGAMYCLALKWWYHSNDLCTTARPGHLHNQLYNLTVASFFQASARPNLSLIQAGLLLLQCSNADDHTLAISSVINTLAYRVALNINCSQWKIPKWEKTLRNRLSWAVFSQCHWIALQESVPSLISASNWDLITMTEDFFEMDGMQQPLWPLFTLMCKLSVIVSDIHTLVIDSRNLSSMEDLLIRVKPIQMNLRRFHQDLEPTQHGEHTLATLSNFSAHLFYISAEVILHRLIITRMSQYANVEAQLVEVCQSAAEARLNAAVDLVMSMKSQHIQHLFAFNSANSIALIGVFAALMATTATNPEKKQAYTDQLRAYIAHLKMFSEYDVISAGIRLLVSSVVGVADLNL